MIERAYAAFNARDIDGALALMSDDVSWPKASEGGKVVGKEEVRAYWTRQWAEFDPHVEPIEIIDLGENRFEVRVRQVVKNLEGDVLFDGEVRHIFTVKNGFIQSMDLRGEEAPSSPTRAFTKR
ncbi:MAG TPA: nuclear transport factor 2 family protein [Gemmatimonadaceae bacterium]|nr:nuclear transport factor 2 family protein [Gemmatimonadaceae bacterium]